MSSNIAHLSNPVPRVSPEKLLEQHRLSNAFDENVIGKEVFLSLYGSNERFLKLIDAIWPEQSVEGTIMDDNVHAAIMMQEKAAELHHTWFAELPTRTVRRVVNRIMKELGIGRKQRKDATLAPGTSK